MTTKQPTAAKSDCAENVNTQPLPVREPVVDLYKFDHRVVLVADLPGVDDSTVQVELEDDTLTIGGESRIAEVEGARWVHREWGDCLFRRSFRLTEHVDRDQVKAVLKHGVLRVELPFREEVRPRKISVQVEA